MKTQILALVGQVGESPRPVHVRVAAWPVRPGTSQRRDALNSVLLAQSRGSCLVVGGGAPQRCRETAGRGGGGRGHQDTQQVSRAFPAVGGGLGLPTQTGTRAQGPRAKTCSEQNRCGPGVLGL